MSKRLNTVHKQAVQLGISVKGDNGETALINVVLNLKLKHPKNLNNLTKPEIIKAVTLDLGVKEEVPSE